MAAKLFRIIPKTAYSFNPAASANTTVAIGPRFIPSIDWVSGVFLVRVHAMTNTNSVVNVYLSNISISPDEPQTNFVQSTVGNVGAANITSATAGSLYSVSFVAPIGDSVYVSLSVTGNATPYLTTMTLSVDLLARDALSIWLRNERHSPMAGELIRIVPKTTYSFNVSTGQVNQIFLGPRFINSLAWVSGVLLVRTHAKSFASTTATAQVIVFDTSFSPDEPQTTFSTQGGGIASVNILNGDLAPLLYSAVLVAPISSSLQLGLALTQGASGGTCSLTLSVDLIGRNN